MGVERGEVEHDAGGMLGLAERRVGGAPADDADPVPAGEAEHPGDVVDGARPQHGVGLLAHDLSEVLGVRPARRLVEQQGAVELGDLVERRLRRPIGGDDPAPGAGVGADDRQAGDRFGEDAPTQSGGAGMVIHRRSFCGGQRIDWTRPTAVRSWRTRDYAVERPRSDRQPGSMLWLSRKRLSGSKRRLISTSRSRFGPYASATLAPSSSAR